MNIHACKALLSVCLAAACGSESLLSRSSEKRPNIVYILADDLGYGDLSCYGQKHFETPNIDALAKKGMLFTQHYSGSSVCAPARSSLLTGLHTGHTPIRGNKEIEPEGQAPLPGDSVTIAEVLQGAGYATGGFGKWGLGFVGSEGDPNNQGFDQFFGYNCQRQAHRYYPEYLWDNDQKRYLHGNDWTRKETYAPDVIHQEALEFIRDNKDQQFFLYYASPIPHAEMLVPKDEIFQRFEGRFPEVPSEGWDAGHEGGAAYGENLAVMGYAPTETPKANFAAMVTRLDQQVGEIVELLEKEGLTENTLIIFTSDNGPHEEGGADPEFFDSNAHLRGVKRDLYEGGIRVPMIANWPGTIEAGQVSDHVSAFWDVFPTFAELAGAPFEKRIDGISFLPELQGRPEKQAKHEYLYWEFHERGGRQALRQDDWKLVKYMVFEPENEETYLFNLSLDPSENNNLAELYPDTVRDLEKILSQERQEIESFPFERRPLAKAP